MTAPNGQAAAPTAANADADPIQPITATDLDHIPLAPDARVDLSADGVRSVMVENNVMAIMLTRFVTIGAADDKKDPERFAAEHHAILRLPLPIAAAIGRLAIQMQEREHTLQANARQAAIDHAVAEERGRGGRADDAENPGAGP